MPAEITDICPFKCRVENPIDEIVRIQGSFAGPAWKHPLTLQPIWQSTKDVRNTIIHSYVPHFTAL
jgi:hypothetical protein